VVQFGFVRQIIPVDLGSLKQPLLSLDDAFFGPYDSQGALYAATYHLVQVILVTGLACLSFLLVSRILKSSSSQKSVSLAHFGLVLLALVDVSVANRWMLAEVPSSVFEAPTKISSQLETLKSKQSDHTPVWLFRSRYQPLPPVSWEQNTSEERLEEVVSWQRESLYPKHHLRDGVTLIGSFCSVWPTYYETELSHFENSVEHELSSNTIQGPNLIVGESPGTAKKESPIAPVIWLGKNHGEEDPVALPVEITSFSSNRLTVKIQTVTSGSLALGRIAEPGWSAKIKNLNDATIEERELVLDRQQETLFLDFDSAGDYEVEFQYLPTGFVVGAVVSLVSVASLVLWCLSVLCLRILKPLINTARH